MVPKKKTGFLYILICVLLVFISFTNTQPAMAQCNISITSPTTLPSVVVGSHYTYQITATGPPTLTYISDTGPPPGLTLSSSGLLSGTPSQAGTYSNFDVQVCSTNALCTVGDCKFKVLSITVVPCPLLSITSTSPLPSGTTGSAYSNQITATGKTPITFSLASGSLPPGLSMGATGFISGTPTASGNYNFWVQARDSCPSPQTTVKQFSLAITCPPISITSPSSLSSGMVALSYSYQIMATGQTPITFTIMGGSLPPGLSMGSTGLISGIPATAGNYNFTVRATDSCSPTSQTTTRSFSLTIRCTTPQITSSSPLPSTMAGLSYTYQIQATGQGAITYSISSGLLPPGLTMNSTGLISGTPTTAGNYNFTVLATDSCLPTPQTTTKLFALTITMYCPPISITSTSPLPSGTVGSSYSRQITATGQLPITFAITGGSLPPGLSMGSTGLISGTPATAGNYNFTVLATDSCFPTPQTNSKLFILLVSAVTFSASVSPPVVNAPVSYTSTQTLNYTFLATPPVNTTMVSPQGIFQVGATQIGVNNAQIGVNISSGRGTVSESVTVLSSIMQKALSMGSSKMTYNRSFTNGVTTVDTQVEIRITTEAAADFRITRMQLYFQNRQPVITIKRNDTTLKTYADINYVGSGLLQGYWEVDGNLLSNVQQTIASGTFITIESPAPPILPVFTSGTHRIRLVITNPSQDIPFPEIRYYVTSEEPKPVEVKKLTPLSILYPHNQSVINYQPVTFLWTMRNGVATYFLEFFQKGEEKTLFSAYTKNPSYSLPEAILKRFFSPGRTYAWKVKGFDALSNVSAESTIFTFTIRE